MDNEAPDGQTKGHHQTGRQVDERKRDIVRERDRDREIEAERY